jgi:hypothetical protein
MSCRGISSLRSEIPDLGRYVNKKMKAIILILNILFVSCATDDYKQQVFDEKAKHRESLVNIQFYLSAHEYLIRRLEPYQKNKISLYPHYDEEGKLSYTQSAQEDLEQGKINYILHGEDVIIDLPKFRVFVQEEFGVNLEILNKSGMNPYDEWEAYLIASYNNEVIKFLINKYGENVIEKEFDKWWKEERRKRN